MNKEEIEKRLNSHLQGTEYFLVELEVKQGGVVDVFVDGDKGIPISECAKISRYITGLFDRNVEDYELRVSSPGLDRPLKLARQYKKYMGRQIEVLMKTGEKISGSLKSCDDTGLTLEEKVGKKGNETGMVTIYFTEIEEAKPVILFK